MPALTSLALGAGALGAIGGAVAGGSDETITAGKRVAPPTQRELDLQNQSFNSYMKQLALSQQGEDAISGGSGIQDTSRGTLENVIGGQAFNINPEQQAQIEAIRNATVQAGTGDIQNFVNQNLSSISNSGGVRGLRGQALSELQGRSIGEGARQISNITGQANATAAQQALDVPFKQAQMQGNLANQNANFMETLRQQAIQNRQQLQNPILMQSLQNERLGSAEAYQTTPGSFGKALGGAAAGFGSMGAGVAGFGKGMKDLNSAGYAHGGVVQPEKDRAWNQREKEEFSDVFKQQPGSFEDRLRRPFSSNEDEEDNYAKGGFVRGGSAPIAGDHTMNDTVHAKLSPGEIVIPRSFAHDPDLSKAFINYLHKKNKPSNKEGA